jgi:hypothetical protein
MGNFKKALSNLCMRLPDKKHALGQSRPRRADIPLRDNRSTQPKPELVDL